VKAFGVFEKQEIEVSAGDKLLLQANWKEKGKNAFKATNGELVTVAAVKPGAIQLQDGRELPADYRQFTYGYAVTAHRSQGKTVDYEVIAADRMPKDLFYVSATRAREGLTVVTSDTSALQESIGVSGDRQSATELARRASALAQTSRYTRHSQTEDFHQYYAQRQSQTNRAQFHQKESISDHASIRPHSSL
jgi:ATP-dependent exoDNAse (exonuclease V) alpha subunit